MAPRRTIAPEASPYVRAASAAGMVVMEFRVDGSRHWTVRVQPAQRGQFVFVATFERSGTPGDILESHYLYGDGDLAVFLEDLGAGTPAIWRLLERLRSNADAEIAIDITEEAMEVLVRGKKAADRRP